MTRAVACVTFLLAALAAGCVTPVPPGIDAKLALRWSVSQGLWGDEVFEVRQDGTGHYSFVPVGQKELGQELDVKVSPEALAKLADTARRVGFCTERSSRDGIPDEGMPTLALQLPGVACKVTLWDGEWSDRSGPREVARLVAAMHRSSGP